MSTALFLVVSLHPLHVLAAFDVVEPGLVLEVPLDGRKDAGLEVVGRLPAELRLELRRIHRIAKVMSRSVLDIVDQGLRLAQGLQDGLDDLEVGSLVVSADVVDLAVAAVSDDQVDGVVVVTDIEPVTDVGTIAVDRKGFVMHRLLDHERDELLRELVGTVVVAASADGDRKTEGPMVCHDKEVCAGLAGGIRGAGLDWGVLGEEQVRSVQRKVAVDLVGGDLVVTFDAVLAAGIHQDAGADDVGLEEDGRVHDGTVDVAFRGEVDDVVEMLLLEELVDRLAVADVRVDEAEIGFVENRFEGLHVAGIGQGIEADVSVLRISLDHGQQEVATDETGTAGD